MHVAHEDAHHLAELDGVPIGAPVGVGQLILQASDGDTLALDRVFELDQVLLDAGKRFGGVLG